MRSQRQSDKCMNAGELRRGVSFVKCINGNNAGRLSDDHATPHCVEILVVHTLQHGGCGLLASLWCNYWLGKASYIGQNDSVLRLIDAFVANHPGERLNHSYHR